jgi:chromosomal replication initiation ATPase DnaA
MNKEKVRKITPFNLIPEESRAIIQLVYEKLDVSYETMLCRTRVADIVEARQICQFIIHKKFKYKLGYIGSFFGGQDHSTIIHSIKRCEGCNERNDRTFFIKLEMFKDILM